MSPPKHYLSGKPPAEKSKFMQTCSRLSLFLKEKGNIRDINFEFNSKSDATGIAATTVDLLSNIDDDTLPQYVILESFCEPQNKAQAQGLTKPKTSQMTVFYDGQVLVIDDVPPDRATDLMLMSTSNSPVVDKDSDLPIARRASLHKFLTKRKDRAGGSPYQLHNGGSSSASGNEHSFDLNM